MQRGSLLYMPAGPGMSQVVPAKVLDAGPHQCLSPSMVVGLGDRLAIVGKHPRGMLANLLARKEPGKYVEGVVLSDKLEALFRNVPPALTLALAMTEKHEKAERAALMREHGCSELEAVYRIADQLSKTR